MLRRTTNPAVMSDPAVISDNSGEGAGICSPPLWAPILIATTMKRMMLKFFFRGREMSRTMRAKP